MEAPAVFNRFGGLNDRYRPNVIGPERSQDNFGVDLSAGTLRNVIAGEVYSAGSYINIYDWNGTIVGHSTVRFTYHEYGGRLIRAWFAPVASLYAPQFTTDASTWDILGIKAPAAACTAADSGGGAGLTGTYTYYVTFYNAYGDESAPSPVSNAITLTDNTMSLTSIPIGYTTATGNGSVTITVVSSAYLRVGMRITAPTNIPAGTYITAISGTTVTLSQATTGGAFAGVTVQDAQVTGRKIYRSGGTVAGVLLVTTIADVTTTTYSDSTADTSLGAAVTTSGFDVLPSTLGGVAISPAGVLMGVKRGSVNGQGDEVHFSEVGAPQLYKSTNYIRLTDPGVRCFYGQERFMILTRGVLATVIGSSVADFQLIHVGPAPVHNPNSSVGRVPCVQMDKETWFPTMVGWAAYDGSSIRFVTADVFSASRNEGIGFVSAAVRWLDKLVCVAPMDLATTGLDAYIYLYDPSIPGQWTIVGWAENAYVSYPAYLDLAFSPAVPASSKPRVLLCTGGISTILGNYLAAEARTAGGYYTTGEWTGGTMAALKKWSRVGVVHKGNVTVTPYIDGVAGTAATLTGAAAYALTRSSFRLPTMTQGRAIAFKVALDQASSEVYEIAALGGDVKRPQP